MDGKDGLMRSDCVTGGDGMDGGAQVSGEINGRLSGR